MAIERLLKMPCTIRRRVKTGNDQFGQPVYTVTEVDTVCYLDQKSRFERSNTLSTDHIDHEKYYIYLAKGTVIEARDQVEALGVIYEVDGEPWEAVRARTGEVHHVEATLKRTS